MGQGGLKNWIVARFLWRRDVSSLPTLAGCLYHQHSKAEFLDFDPLSPIPGPPRVSHAYGEILETGFMRMLPVRSGRSHPVGSEVALSSRLRSQGP